MKSIKLTYITGIILTAVAACLFSSCKDGDSGRDASGTFEATEVIVSSEVSGRIVSLDVQEGTVVRAGQACGAIDTVMLHLQRQQLEAAIRAALSRRRDEATQTAGITEQIRIQQQEAERVRKLIEAGAANTKQLDDIAASIAVQERQLDALRADIVQNNAIALAEAASYEAQLASVEESLRRCRIASPIDGTVIVKYAQAGEITAAGKPLFKVADLQNMVLRAYISSSQLSTLKLGQKVRVLVDFGADNTREYEGILSWISDRSEFTPKSVRTADERSTLVYAVKVSFENDGYVKLGMYGDLRF